MNTNCIGQESYTGCTEYTGPSYPDLGIYTGDDLNKVLSKISDALGGGVAVMIQANDAKLNSLSTDDIEPKVDISTLSTSSSICSSQIVQRDFSYSLKSETGQLKFFWDFSNVTSGLPNSFDVTKVIVSLYGERYKGTSLIGSSQARSSSMIINSNRFPARAEISVRVSSPCGNLELFKIIDITNGSTTGDFRTNMGVKSLFTRSESPKNLTEVIQEMSNELVEVKRSIEDLKNNA